MAERIEDINAAVWKMAESLGMDDLMPGRSRVRSSAVPNPRNSTETILPQNKKVSQKGAIDLGAKGVCLGKGDAPIWSRAVHKKSKS